MSKCICGKETNDIIVNAYGEVRCENCFDDYLMTDKGKVEYLIGIVRGDYSMDCFDADFLGHVAVCWKKHRNDFSPYMYPSYKLEAIEAKAELLGLL